MIKISLKELASNAVHFGHKVARWNPKMKEFIYTQKNGIHIFDLRKTAHYLKEALEFLEKMSSLHKTVLFVGTKQHCKKLLEDLAEATNSPYVTQKWICGLLTNYKTIKKRIRHLKNLEEDEKSGEIQKYTKKEQLKLKKEKEKLQMSLGGVKEMQSPPDVLFVVDATRDRNAIIEANKLRIPVVSIVDTCSDPEMVDYVIPANDDALKSLIYILNLVKTVLLEGKQKKQAKKEEKKDEQKDEQKEIEQKSETKALL